AGIGAGNALEGMIFIASAIPQEAVFDGRSPACAFPHTRPAQRFLAICSAVKTALKERNQHTSNPMCPQSKSGGWYAVAFGRLDCPLNNRLGGRVRRARYGT